MPEGEGEDVLLPKRKKPPEIWQITMIDAIIAAHNNAALAEECAAEIAANVAAAAAAAALSSPLPSLQPPTSIAVAIVAAANYKDHIYAANKPMPSRKWQPTHQLTHRHFQASGGSHPFFARDPDCAADGMSTAAQEMKGGISWELAVAKAESATAVAATTKAAAIKTMAANAPSDPQTLLGFRGIAPFVTGTTVTCDPECAADGMSTAAQEMKGGLSWELAVGG